MKRTLKKFVESLTREPKSIFMIDGVGALMTAFFLYVVLRNVNDYVGMPITILTYLSMIAICLSIYSITCYLVVRQNFSPYIWGIIIANSLYCILTTWLVMTYYSFLIVLGVFYFAIELFIITMLIIIELRLALEIKRTV